MTITTKTLKLALLGSALTAIAALTSCGSAPETAPPAPAPVYVDGGK